MHATEVVHVADQLVEAVEWSLWHAQQHLKLWRALLLIAGHIVSYNVLQFLKAITAKVNKQNKGGMVQRSGHEGSAVISCMTSALMLWIRLWGNQAVPCSACVESWERKGVWGCLGDVWGYAHWLLVQGHGRPKHCQVPCQKLPVDLRECTDWKPIFWLANQRNTDAESCQIWARRACISESNFTMFMTFMPFMIWVSIIFIAVIAQNGRSSCQIPDKMIEKVLKTGIAGDLNRPKLTNQCYSNIG